MNCYEKVFAVKLRHSNVTRLRRLGPQCGHRIDRAFTILRDKQSETIEDRVRKPMTILRDRVGTGT